VKGSDRPDPAITSSSLEALLFDVDGTLADTEETHRQAFNYAFVRFRLEWNWTPALYRELLSVSGGRERILAYIETVSRSQSEKQRLHALVPAIHEAKTLLYTELIGDGRCPLRPGVARLLTEAMQSGVQLAIASTTTSANVHALLDRHLGRGSRPRFDVIACADAVERKKPAPDIYRQVVAMLGRSPAQCVAFEDSENGLRAAKGAGLFTVVTPSMWTRDGDFSAADLVLAHLGDPERPLADADATRLGRPWLSLAELAHRHGLAMQPDGAGTA